MLERDLERAMVHRVESIGGLHYKFTSPGRRGVPDRIVIFPGGKLVFVEMKRPGESLRADQLREHGRLADLGQSVWTLASILDINAFFRYHGF
ncbi:hypothetical protein [Caudoviricetes sp.]|nr:hypothetical protein [Caudoviricetes sp.]